MASAISEEVRKEIIQSSAIIGALSPAVFQQELVGVVGSAEANGLHRRRRGRVSAGVFGVEQVEYRRGYRVGIREQVWFWSS
jgi:hypothetical protein